MLTAPEAWVKPDRSTHALYYSVLIHARYYSGSHASSHSEHRAQRSFVIGKRTGIALDFVFPL